MKHTEKLVNHISTDSKQFYYEPVNVCPICKAIISPIFISASLDTDSTASIFDYCNNCHQTFVTQHKIEPRNPSSSFYEDLGILSSEPNRFVKQDFDPRVSALSPQFDKIYNQALAAETAMLDEIAGLGYRKSLEFLIKDFAIHEHPDAEETIKSAPLSQCIRNYISADNIKTLAERSAWIGNDEAHYIRKQEDRDVSDMKNFIQACVYFIAMTLITEDAKTMTPK